MIKKLIAYLLAVVSTYFLGVMLVTQFNIAKVTEMGFEVLMAQRLSALGQDQIGMLGTYLPLISVALLLAFLFTSLVLLRFFERSFLLFVVAGFVAILTLHLVMEAVLGIAGIAPTRTIIGLLCQGGAGALGGYFYFHVTRKID